ncbi:MAG: tetratricopeptide repeat protein [Candidatus Odinarchaeota archaeon]
MPDNTDEFVKFLDNCRLRGEHEKGLLSIDEWRKKLSIDDKNVSQDKIISVDRFKAEFLLLTGKLKEATKLIDDLLEKSKNLDPKLYHNVLVFSAVLYTRTGDYQEATRRLKASEDYYSEQTVETNGLALTHLAKGRLEALLGNFEYALELTYEALLHFESLGEKGLYYTGIAMNRLGRIYFLQSKLVQAEHYYNKYLSLSNSIGNLRGQAVAYNNIAEIQRVKGEFRACRENYEKSKQIDVKLGNKEGLAISHLNLATIDRIQGDYDKSLVNLEEALRLFKENDIKRGLADTFAELGHVEHLRGETALAREYYERSFDFFDKLELEEDLVRHLFNYGIFLVDQKDLRRAKEITRWMRKLATKHDSVHEQLHHELLQGMLEKTRDNKGKAKKLLEEVYNESKKNQANLLTVNACIALAELSLESYQLKYGEEDIDSVLKYVNEAGDLAKNENLHPIFVQALLIKGSLFLLNLDFNKSIKIFTEAVILAEEKKLLNLQQQARKIVETHQKRFEIYAKHRNSESDVEERIKLLAVSEAFNYMRQIMERFNPPKEELKKEEMLLVIIRVTDQGIRQAIQADELTPRLQRGIDYQRAGFYFSMALSQGGEKVREGLYGPLPVPELTDHVSLVYAKYFKSLDEKNDLLLFCLFYPVNKGSQFYDRFKIEVTFQSMLAMQNTIHDLNATFHEELKHNLYNAIISSRLG